MPSHRPQVVSMLVAAVRAAPQDYLASTSSGEQPDDDLVFFGEECGLGKVLHASGTCVTPSVSTDVYVFTAPETPQSLGPPPDIPVPKVEQRVLFIRVPEQGLAQDPIVVPPPQQKNIVYVLSKHQRQEPQIIHAPAPEQRIPEVYFVSYGKGDNPTLPYGEDLHSSLSSATSQGGDYIIGSAAGAGSGSYVGGGGRISSGNGFLNDGGFVSGGGGGAASVDDDGGSGTFTPSAHYGPPQIIRALPTSQRLGL
ncbi:uncharacterized protein [Panulirus ornatus]|uniref:uncharacterized protein n=1 Tax=Panulirus ornatus TaxID=150431 RepID=UPI003A848A75